LANREREIFDLVAGRRRQLEERIRLRGDLVRRERAVDAFERLRLRDVDRDDARVRVRRADEVDVAHPVRLDVVGEHALALQEAAVLLARDRGAGVADLQLGRLLGEGLRLAHAWPSAAVLIASTMFT